VLVKGQGVKRSAIFRLSRQISLEMQGLKGGDDVLEVGGKALFMKQAALMPVIFEGLCRELGVRLGEDLQQEGVQRGSGEAR